MAETQPQHRLIIYDQNGNIIWDGLLTSPFPVLEPGRVFWAGGFAPPQKRQWYTVEKSMTGVETQAGRLVTELVVSRSKEKRADSRPSCEHSDQPSRAVKQREKGELQAIEEVEEFAVERVHRRKTSWRNSAKTVRIDFIPNVDHPSWMIYAECFIESRRDPVHKQAFFRDIGDRADIPLDKGKLTILLTATDDPKKLCFQIIEFGRGI